MTNNKTHMQIAGWSSTWSDFLATSQETFLAQLEQFHNQLPWTDNLDLPSNIPDKRIHHNSMHPESHYSNHQHRSIIILDNL